MRGRSRCVMCTARLPARRDAANRAEPVARAYAVGVLTPGVWPQVPASAAGER